MGNEILEDVAVVSALAELKSGGLLKSSAEIGELQRQLKSEWGKRVFRAYNTNGRVSRKDKQLLQRYSAVFK